MPEAFKPRLILASASPRRAMLLREAGFQFDVIPSPVEEPVLKPDELTPATWAEFISRFKAETVAKSVRTGLVLAADTITVLRSEIFGKPSGREDARRILEKLSGTTHNVITGVTLFDAASSHWLTRHALTKVAMRRLSPSQLEAYLDSGAWVGKAGAYGIQDHNDPFVETIEGSFSNVVGLPMETLSKMLEEWKRLYSQESLG